MKSSSILSTCLVFLGTVLVINAETSAKPVIPSPPAPPAPAITNPTSSSSTSTTSTSTSTVSSQPTNVNTDTDCVSLRNSKVCSAWSNMMISKSALGLTGNDEKTVIEMFDSFVSNYSATSELARMASNSLFACERWDGTNYQNFRYIETFRCSDYILSKSRQCNLQNNKLTTMKKPVCNKVCQQLETSLNSVFNDGNTQWCEERTAFVNTRGQTFAQWVNSCKLSTWSTDPSDCVYGASLDASQCGFIEAESKSKYCSSAEGKKDGCCKDKSGGLSTTMVIVIAVVAGVSFLALTIGGTCWTLSRMSRKGKLNQEETPKPELVLPKRDQVTTNIQPLPVAKNMTVSRPYRAIVGDEIDLHIGDEVVATGKVNSEYYYGMNLTTKKEGIFPVSNVKSRGTVASKKADKLGIHAAPEKITHSLSKNNVAVNPSSVESRPANNNGNSMIESRQGSETTLAYEKTSSNGSRTTSVASGYYAPDPYYMAQAQQMYPYQVPSGYGYDPAFDPNMVYYPMQYGYAVQPELLQPELQEEQYQQQQRTL